MEKVYERSVWGHSPRCANTSYKLTEGYIREMLYGLAKYDGDKRPGIAKSNVVVKLYDTRATKQGTTKQKGSLRGMAISSKLYSYLKFNLRSLTKYEFTF